MKLDPFLRLVVSERFTTLAMQFVLYDDLDYGE